MNNIIALLPAHNEESSIADTVSALLLQDRRLDRIIVICDNCTDNTFDVAASVAHGADNVTIVNTVNNAHKKSGALNWAWRNYAQQADLVVTLDADTVLPPNAVADWEQEFAGNIVLAGSSSKFTMRGDGFLTRLQRAEFARWTDTGLRRGWTSVLAGTACMIRNNVLVKVAARDDRSGPWVYTSQVEDFELTYRIREMGYHCHISPTVRAYTEAMQTMSALWNQRMKWQVGTVEDLKEFGVNKLTQVDWMQQLAGVAAAFVRFMWIALTLIAVLMHTFDFQWWWLAPTVIFIVNDTKQSLLIPHRDKRDVLMAMILIPQEFFAWMRAAWFLTAWYEVLSRKVTGNKKDRWALQIAAEQGGK